MLLRGSTDFAGLDAYRRFVDEVVGPANAGRRKLLEIDRVKLQPLPPRRTDDFDEELVNVTRSSGFPLRHVFYTVSHQADRPPPAGSPVRRSVGMLPRQYSGADLAARTTAERGAE
jgi:hypothetical protein